jgi:hypothetical protein
MTKRNWFSRPGSRADWFSRPGSRADWFSRPGSRADWIATAAGIVFLATLSTVACKKEETATPADATPSEDAADDEADEPDEVDAPDEADAAEPLTKSSFDETIHEHMQEVSDCYVVLLESNPDAKGKLEADFTFGADGVPTGVVAATGSTLTDASLVQCIADASKGWGFGVPKEEGMTLRYSFNLEPAG